MGGGGLAGGSGQKDEVGAVVDEADGQCLGGLDVNGKNYGNNARIRPLSSIPLPPRRRIPAQGRKYPIPHETRGYQPVGSLRSY